MNIALSVDEQPDEHAGIAMLAERQHFVSMSLDLLTFVQAGFPVKMF